METYQVVISLIGCIFGILLTIGLFLVVGTLMGTSDVSLQHEQTNGTGTNNARSKQVFGYSIYEWSNRRFAFFMHCSFLFCWSTHVEEHIASSH